MLLFKFNFKICKGEITQILFNLFVTWQLNNPPFKIAKKLFNGTASDTMHKTAHEIILIIMVFYFGLVDITGYTRKHTILADLICGKIK